MVAPRSRPGPIFVLSSLAVVSLACGAGGKASPVDPGTAESETPPPVESASESSPVDPPANGESPDNSASAGNGGSSVEEASAEEYPEVEIPSPEPPEVDSEPATADTPTDPSASKDEADSDPTLTIIESASNDDGSRGPSLVEAAAAERARRQTAPPSSIVITDKNLSDHAVGQLTVAVPRETVATDADSPQADDSRSEEYWRTEVRAIRTEWAEAAERAEDLEAEVFHLRQRFYAEDDGFYRDSQIKPAWDRAIEELQETNDRIEEIQEELARFLEEGREAGALPGWLREGVELEPEVEPEDDGVYVEPDRNELEPGEPVVVEEYEQDSGR